MLHVKQLSLGEINRITVETLRLFLIRCCVHEQAETTAQVPWCQTNSSNSRITMILIETRVVSNVV